MEPPPLAAWPPPSPPATLADSPQETPPADQSAPAPAAVAVSCFNSSAIKGERLRTRPSRAAPRASEFDPRRPTSAGGHENQPILRPHTNLLHPNSPPIRAPSALRPATARGAPCGCQCISPWRGGRPRPVVGP